MHMRASLSSSPRLVLVTLAVLAGSDVRAGEPTKETARHDPALLAAARTGDVEAVQARLRSGADADAPAPSGETPLIAAAVNGRLEAARALVEAGADLDAHQRGWGSPLDAAERAGQDELAA